jgi:hypothetical protein
MGGVIGLICLDNNQRKVTIKVNPKSNLSKPSWIGNEEIKKTIDWYRETNQC